MRKRDLVAEINSIKSRTEFNSRYDFSSRLYDIEYALNEFSEYNGNFNNELLKYIPISTIACFEAFFRSVIKEFVDFGEPYSLNVAKFSQSKNIKIDFDMISAIQAKTLTVGELVAHLLPFNNLEDILSNVSIILDKPFVTELKNYNKLSPYGDTNEFNENTKNRLEDIFKSVQKTYELRHIFCHEFATNVDIDRYLIKNNFEDCKSFLEYCNNVIWNILYPNSPETQIEINEEADSTYKLKDSELKDLIEFIVNNHKEMDEDSSISVKQFLTSIKIWKKYRDSVAAYTSSLYSTGSMHPLIYSNAMERITTEKIQSLKSEFESFLKKKNYYKELL